MVSPTTPTRVPRVTLLSLPPEIKTRIVSLAWQQDERYRTMVKTERGILNQVSGISLAWYGRGTSALFLVNKELSGLAAAWLFQNLDAARLSSIEFRLFILPRYARHFRSLDFGDEASPDACEYALSLLLLFPHIDRLTATEKGLRALYGLRDDSTAKLINARLPIIWTSLAAAGSHIVNLTLQSVSPECARSLLSRLPKLCHLHITGRRAFADLAKLALSVATFEHLQYLALDAGVSEGFGGTVTPTCDHSWTVGEWKSVGTLKTLRLRSRSCGADELAFIERFATSLETLDLEFATDSSVDSIPPFTSPFPRLTSLRLKIPVHRMAAFLSPFAKSPLQHLHIIPIDIDKFSTFPALGDFLGGHASTLCTIAVSRCILDAVDGRDQDVDVADTSWLVSACDILEVTLSRHGVVDVFNDRPPPVEADREDELKVACRAVDEVLRWGLNQSARARVNGDQEGIKELTVLLRGLHTRRQIEWQ